MFVNQFTEHRIFNQQNIVQETFKIVVTVNQAVFAFPHARATRQEPHTNRFAVGIQHNRKFFLFKFFNSLVQQQRHGLIQNLQKPKHCIIVTFCLKAFYQGLYFCKKSLRQITRNEFPNNRTTLRPIQKQCTDSRPNLPVYAVSFGRRHTTILDKELLRTRVHNIRAQRCDNVIKVWHRISKS